MGKRGYFKNLIRLCVVLCLVFLSFGCAKHNSTPIRIATNIWPGYEPLYLARTLGYYGDLPVNLFEMPSSTDVEASFRNGSIDAAALTLDETYLLLQDDFNIKILLVTDVSSGADVLLAHPSIQKLKQIKGKRIGVENTALGAYVLSRALDFASLTTNDIAIIPMTVDRHEQAYASGEVDAVVTFEPVRTKLLAQGARSLFDSSMIPDEIFDVLVVSDDFYKANREELQKLTSAWFKAVDYIKDNPDRASEMMAGREGVSARDFKESLNKIIIPDMKMNSRLLTGPRPEILNPAEKLAAVMLEKKLIKHKVEPATLLPEKPVTGQVSE